MNHLCGAVGCMGVIVIKVRWDKQIQVKLAKFPSIHYIHYNIHVRYQGFGGVSLNYLIGYIFSISGKNQDTDTWVINC